MLLITQYVLSLHIIKKSNQKKTFWGKIEEAVLDLAKNLAIPWLIQIFHGLVFNWGHLNIEHILKPSYIKQISINVLGSQEKFSEKNQHVGQNFSGGNGGDAKSQVWSSSNNNKEKNCTITWGLSVRDLQIACVTMKSYKSVTWRGSEGHFNKCSRVIIQQEKGKFTESLFVKERSKTVAQEWDLIFISALLVKPIRQGNERQNHWLWEFEGSGETMILVNFSPYA